MPIYDYKCGKCSTEKRAFIFEAQRGMTEKIKIKCPKCGSVDTEQHFGMVPMFYVKGYGWLDKKGRRRDMNLHKLQNDDPYAKYRVPGEKDDLVHRLKKGGKRDPKRQHFMTGK
jgi:putative FmdB family regulatory protein